ncbi:MAG: ParB/RepB/Spo0J family partition protein [Leptolyngbya sp. SIO4C1]|nr:ParB/RepB/Spo0J family partition protein [Leptolyngbya sp. SIO4C1]
MAKLPSIAKRFDSAVKASDHARQIADLQTEIERLRHAQSPELEAQLSVLREQLKAQSGEQDIAIALIDPNPYQPRQTITPESVHTLAKTLAKDGQITPVIVIPQGERYLLWDGQRRWEASQQLGWETIRAVTAPMPSDLHRKALLTFVHHEDLNPLDKAEAIVKEVSSATDLDEETIPVILSTVLRRLERQKQVQQLNTIVSADADEQQGHLHQLGVSPSEAGVLLALTELALYPPSVRSNLMPMLSLPLDLKTAIRDRGLKGAHALALASLSAKNLKVAERKATKERLEATEQVLTQKLTVAQTRELVRQIKAKFVTAEAPASKTVNTAVKRLKKLTPSTLETTSREQLESLHRALKTKLAEVEALLS